MNRYVRNFLFILGGGLVSAFLGSLFGVVIAILSPDFAKELFFTKSPEIVRYSAAVGMISGLFIGAGAMAFVMLVAAMANWFGPRKTEASE